MGKMFNFDIKEFAGAVMLGVVAGALASITERVDAALTGGRYTPLGYINTYTWIIVSAMLFGPRAPIVTTEVQAFIGLVTFANPLSWLWPIINLVFAISVGISLVCIERFKPHLGIGTKVALLSLTCAILDVPMVYVVIVMVLNLPFLVYLISLPIYVILQLIPTTLLAYEIVKRLKRLKIMKG